MSREDSQILNVEERTERKPLIVEFGVPFTIDPILEPTEEQLEETKGIYAYETGEVVDVIDFQVRSSNISGQIEVIRVETALEKLGVSIETPAGPINPYIVEIDLLNPSGEPIKFDLNYGNKIYSAKLEADGKNLLSQGWLSPQNLEEVSPVFPPQAVSNIEFLIQKR